MFQTPLLALCTLLLASGALSTESPQPRTGLKQATRDSIVRQQDLRNRGFRRQVPTTGTYPTCPNFSTGTVNHAVYPDTAAVPGTVYSTTTQSDLQSCILTCCASRESHRPRAQIRMREQEPLPCELSPRPRLTPPRLVLMMISNLSHGVLGPHRPPMQHLHEYRTKLGLVHRRLPRRYRERSGLRRERGKR